MVFKMLFCKPLPKITFLRTLQYSLRRFSGQFGSHVAICWPWRSYWPIPVPRGLSQRPILVAVLDVVRGIHCGTAMLSLRNHL